MATGNTTSSLTTEQLQAIGGGEPVILEALSAGRQVVVPGGAMLLAADFAQAGPHLVITGADGTTVVVQDYFAVAESPVLQTAGGAALPADLVRALAGAGAPMQVAQEDGAVGAQPIGTVDTVEGTVVAIRAGGTRELLTAGDPVYQGDVLESAAAGSIAVTFADDSTFTLGADARMVLDELIYDPATQAGTSSFSVVQGLFTFVSGAIAKSGSDAMTVRTPVATIRVRGTQIAVQAAAEGEDNVITLLGEEGGIT